MELHGASSVETTTSSLALFVTQDARGMILQPAVRWLRPQRCASLSTHRSLSRWARNVAEPSHQVQSYISKSHDPYLNLSIEHYLLENSPAKSTILFLYVNRPCIVIGRNQNPWLEVNLGALEAGRQRWLQGESSSRLNKIDLVRRRSGGGTVFHDYGNVNWTVICPSEIFTRDRHAEMIVRCLRSQGVARARVNERHDLVLDQGTDQGISDPADFHKTPWTTSAPDTPRALKVSGSAYKLTRGRALHHGTCLLSSPNLDLIHQYLRSPSRPFIKAKGVESVSSPVANLGLDTEAFQQNVRREFLQLYPSDRHSLIEEEIGEEMLDEPQIKRGVEELRTSEWLTDQTPQFSFNTHKVVDENQASLSDSASTDGIQASLNFRQGQVTDAKIDLANYSANADEIAERLQRAVIGRHLRGDWLWSEVFSSSSIPEVVELGTKLDQMLPTGIAKFVG